MKAGSGNLPCCLNVTAHVDHRFGGLTTSVPDFCKSIADTGRYSAPLAAFCLAGEQEPQDWDQPGLRFPFGRMQWAMPGSDLRRRLESALQQASLVHVHGIWQEHCSLTTGAARKLGKPYVVSAHGMLEPWALRNKRLKKSIYWNLLERGNLAGAHCLRALTRAEADHYRSAGLRRPVAVIPNGVTIPDDLGPDDMAAMSFRKRFSVLEGKRVLLFMSRIHYKKGLDLLCRAWSRMCGEYRDAHLVLAGPDSEGTQEGLKRLIDELGIADRVLFAGMLRGSEKWSALRAATAFVLPSYSEGFSVAILEAMGAGTPVVISEQCYFEQVREHACGWVIPPRAAELETALRECLEIAPSDRAAMGERGRTLVRDRFSWPAVGRQMADLSDWILGGAPPSSLEIVKS